MEDPAKASDGGSTRANPGRASLPPPLPKIQVKSQNPISKPPPEELPPSSPSASRKPSPERLRKGGGSLKSPAAELAPKAPERLRGGSGPAQAATPKSPKSPSQSRPQTPKAPKSPKSPKSTVRSQKTPSFVPADMITPVFPASPEDMVGAQTSMETGLTYPWNIWGPITKYGYLDDVAPTWAQRHHFGGKHDKLSKKRLQRRSFCFVRHPAYKVLIEPEEKSCASYLDPKRKEFWRTDVDNVLKREMKAEKDRYKTLLEYIGNEEGWRKSELRRDRENRWQAFLDYDKNVKWYPGFRNNQSGVKYDIFTHAPTDEYEVKRVNAENMKASYMLAKRGLYIQERMSGARPYNIISWGKVSPCRELPEWPADIGPPPGPRIGESQIPLNASKGACSFAYAFGPFGTIG